MKPEVSAGCHHTLSLVGGVWGRDYLPLLWLLVLMHVGVICIRELGIPIVCKKHTMYFNFRLSLKENVEPNFDTWFSSFLLVFQVRKLHISCVF